MAHITGEAPGEEEVQRLLAAVDKDQSGTVSLDEFLEAVGEWLSESGSGKKKFKTLTAEEEKKELHHQIKGFFSQFRKAEDYEAVRQKISEASDVLNGMDTGVGWFGFRSEGQTSQQKLDYLQHYHSVIGSLDGIILSLQSNTAERLTALASLEKILSITEMFSRPAERSAVADDLAQLFESLVRCNLTDHLVSILQMSGDNLSQGSALKCLAMFVPGPRVPSTPSTSLMHPKQAFFKRMAIASDAPQVSARFLNFNSPLTCENAAFFVAAMVSSDHEVRDYFLENHILSLLCPLVLQSTPTHILKPISDALAALCGVTHSPHHLPAWELIQPAFIPLGQLLFSDDDNILSNVLNAFCLVLPGIRPDYNVIARILEIVATHPAPRVVQEALEVISHVARFDAIQTTAFMARGLLDAVKTALTSDHSIVRSACLDVIDVLANVRMQYQALVNSAVLEVIANLMATDDALRVKLVSTVISLTQGSSLVATMVRLGFLPILCGGLSWFKEYDNVISEAYAVEGPTFNYELISDIATAIENIVMVGESERMEQNLALNPYFLQLNAESIGYIHGALSGLSEVVSAGAENFRRNRDSEAKGQLEQRLFSLLQRIYAAVDAANAFQLPNQQKEATKASIEKILTEFGVSTNPDQPEAPSTVLIKCYLPDDIRIFEVARNITYDDLVALLTVKYGRNLSVSYLDAEGDPVRLDADSMVVAFASMNQATDISLPTVKLHLTDRSTPSKVTPAPQSPPSEDEDAMKTVTKKRSRTGSNVAHSVNAPKVPVAFSNNVRFAKAEEIDWLGSADAMKNEFATMRLVQKKHSFLDLRDVLKVNNKDFESALEYLSEGNALTRKQFTEIMNLFGVTDPLVIAHNFNAHDTDRDGTIDFREFAVLLATVAQVSDEEKLKLMFRAYDADHSGNLSLDEIFNIFRAASGMNDTVASDEQLLETVSAVFKEIDLDGNGEISFDEFVQGVNSGKLPILIPSSS